MLLKGESYLKNQENIGSDIETIIDQLKNISQIEHTRHRSVNNFLANLMAGIGAYALKNKKPTIKIINNIDLQ